MDKLIVQKTSHLGGSIEVGRAKNALLPLIAGIILCEEEVELMNVPALRDIKTIHDVLSHLGVKIQDKGEGHFSYLLKELSSHEAPYDLVRTMRASICVLGPLLTRFGKAKVSLPGGCAIGSRPINLHLENLEKMGATIHLTGGYVEATCNKLKGTKLVLDFPSVGATENLMMAATLAEGETVIENAALEPEVTDLGNFLNFAGAKIEGLGTKTLKITGVESLKGTRYTAIGDRIEAATYIIAALMTNSELNVLGFNPDHLDSVLKKLSNSGAVFERSEKGVKVFKSKMKSFQVDTAPYPGFPTDVQAQMMALATQVEGTSIIRETIFENRFMHVPELIRMGADITLKGNSAIVNGPSKLLGAPVMCTDLRASAALVLAGLVADGETHVRRVYHLDRGYAGLEKKLNLVGANIKRVGE